MRTNTRVVSRRPPPRGSRIGSTLVGLGFVSILSVVFFGGVVAGRHYPKLLPSLGGTVVAKEPRRGSDGRLAERGKSVEPAPVPARSWLARASPARISFYQELTAPLTSPPPATRKSERAKPEPARTEPAKAAQAAEKASSQPAGKTDVAATPPASSAPAATSARFTVQVGAFKVREQADAIRARLAASGHDAFVADLDSPEATRYRVRVGSYESRDEARRAAERLSATERLATYVTLR